MPGRGTHQGYNRLPTLHFPRNNVLDKRLTAVWDISQAHALLELLKAEFGSESSDELIGKRG